MGVRTLTVAMLAGTLLAAFAAAPARAFECPAHFDAAQAEIDRVGKALSAADQASPADRALVHALLDDARMLLSGARHDHEKPQGAYDHARAIAKADSALGYARAAERMLARIDKN